MASIKTNLAWAIPMKMEVLGAHVEVYEKLLPTLNTLRLCNRFGKGAPITSLPAELILCIEDFLIEKERGRIRKAWARDLRCFEQKCQTRDHFSKAGLKWHRRILKLGAHKFAEAFHQAYMSCSEDEERDECFDDWLKNQDDYWNCHLDRRQSWEERMPFRNTQDILMKYFGLDLWTSTLRLDDCGDVDCYAAADTTIAYLCLPGGMSREHAAKWSPEEKEGDWFKSTGTCSTMDLTSLPKLSRSGKTRVKRALNILNVKPHLHQTQKPYTISKGKAKPLPPTEKTKKETSMTWPRLTMLTSSTCEFP